jgi:PAS domain S-box-containing protein
MALVGLGILVVDDDLELAQSTCRLLGQAGYQVSLAGNGAEALQHACAHPPDLVLLDRVLPDLDGMEVCRRIKAHPACASVLVMLVSGVCVSAEEQLAGLATGADGYLVRPLGNAELLVRVEAFARLARLNRRLAEELERRRLLEAELDERVRLRTRELTLANEKLEEAHRSALELMLKAARAREHLASTNETLRGEIVKRQQTEEALRLSEQKFAKAFQASPDVVVISRTEDGLILEVNDAWEHVFKYRREEAIGKTSLQLGLFADPEDRHRAMAELRARGCVRDFELAVRDKEGAIHQATLAIENLEIGRQPCVLTALRDITERKRAEAELTRSRAELKAIYDHAPVMLCVVDADRRVLYANPAFTAFTGVPEAALQDGRACGVFGCLNAQDDPRGCGFGAKCMDCALRLALEDTLKTGEVRQNVEYHTVLARDGYAREVTLLGSTALIDRDGRPSLLLCLHDITQRRAAERALRESEHTLSRTNALLRSIMESPQDMVIFALDTDCRYTIFTRAHQQTMRALWGVEIELGMSMLDAISKVEDREKARLNFDRALRGSHFIEIEEYGNPDHQRTYYEDRYGPVHSQDGAICGLTVFVTDITERRRADEQLRLYSEQLRAFSARLEELREAERTKIAREIHDELGQLLTGLKMDLKWIEHDLERLGDSPALNPVLDKVVSATELVDATAKAVQRIASELRPGILDKLGLVMALRYETKQFQQRTGITTQLDAPEAELVLPEPVTTAVFRICQEALTNVARHAGATEVAIRFIVQPDRLTLHVSDNGKGITANAIAHPGSLGLLGMQERARQLGGVAGITPRPQGGTLVTLELPRSAAQTKTT